MKKKTTLPYIMNVLTGNRMTFQKAVKTVCGILYNTMPEHYVNTSTGQPISFEDVLTVICTEFVKETEKMAVDPLDYIWDKKGKYRKPYLKMNFEKRLKISAKLLQALDE